jgi:hypothetical protein
MAGLFMTQARPPRTNRGEVASEPPLGCVFRHVCSRTRDGRWNGCSGAAAPDEVVEAADWRGGGGGFQMPTRLAMLTSAFKLEKRASAGSQDDR